MAYTVVEQPSATVAGRQMPLLGLGTWKSSPGEVANAVEVAIKAGYRHIDCASIYGNEKEVGAALGRVLASGAVRREELWVTSKLWNDKHAAELVEPACRKTLEDLGLEYLDLYLIHWPVGGGTPIKETWQAMEGLVDKGLAKAIGVSNFGPQKLADVLAYARVKPAVDQVEAHPGFRNEAVLECCSANGIHVSAYSPLGSPDSATMAIIDREGFQPPLKDETVNAIAAKLGKTPGQVLIRWGIQRGTSVLPKSVNEGRIRENLAAAHGWELPAADFAALSALPHQQRAVDGGFFCKPDAEYKTKEELWA